MPRWLSVIACIASFIALSGTAPLVMAQPAGPRFGGHWSLPRKQRAHAAIIGGTPAADGTFPWLAHVEDFRGQDVYGCSGTVVAPNLVLTAGHCAENETEVENPASGFVVETGAVDRNAPEAQLSLVSALMVFPSYVRSRNDDGDVALLLLSTPTTAPAITLLAGEPEGKPATVAGWGHSTVNDPPARLQWGTQTVQSGEWCEQHASTNSEAFDASAQLCALSTSEETTTCSGDSGGPLIEEASPSVEAEVGVIDQVISVSREGEETVNCAASLPDEFASVGFIGSWADTAISVLGPLASPSATLMPEAATPGRYVSVGARGHKIEARVSGDGLHVVHLLVTARINCQHGYEDEPEVDAFSYGASLPVRNHVATTPIELPASRYARTGRIGIYLRFGRPGYIEGRVRIRIPAKGRAGLCYAQAIPFIARWVSS
jgi:V8-like Glu-specific endopeptidase